MQSKECAICWVEGVPVKEKTTGEVTGLRVRMRIFNPLQGKAFITADKLVSLKRLDDLCTEYWSVVNDAVKRNLLGNQQQSKSFIGKAISRGDTIRRELMDGAAARDLWTLAHHTPTLSLVIPDRLLHVPWEALFHADTEYRSFLADHTVIARHPENNQSDHGLKGVRSDFDQDRIVCLDCDLQSQLEPQFADEQLHFPRNHMDLADLVRGTRLTHWICEHAERGLRFHADEYFTAADTSAHRFPAGSVLMLTSCKSGAHTPDTASIAAKICCFSDCTVIAPSSLIAVDVGVEFVKEINQAIKAASAKNGLTVASFWRRLSATRVAGLANSTYPFQSSAWSALWYGIYGDVDRLLRGVA